MGGINGFGGGDTIPSVDDFVTIDGRIEGDSIRQIMGQRLGGISKSIDPLTIEYQSRTLPILSINVELDHQLIECAGQNVKLKGQIMTCLVHGRGQMNPQAGYSGPIPDHLLEYLTVYKCELLADVAQ